MTLATKRINVTALVETALEKDRKDTVVALRKMHDTLTRPAATPAAADEALEELEEIIAIELKRLNAWP